MSIGLLPDSNYIICGAIKSNQGDSTLLLKIDEDGDLISAYNLGKGSLRDMIVQENHTFLNLHDHTNSALIQWNHNESVDTAIGTGFGSGENSTEYNFDQIALIHDSLIFIHKSSLWNQRSHCGVQYRS